MKYFSRLVVVVELKGTGYHLALVFTASLSEVENGVKPCRICTTFWRIQTKLICCIEDFKVFAGNWTLVLCERNQSCRARSFSDGFRAFSDRFSITYYIYVICISLYVFYTVKLLLVRIEIEIELN